MAPTLLLALSLVVSQAPLQQTEPQVQEPGSSAQQGLSSAQQPQAGADGGMIAPPSQAGSSTRAQQLPAGPWNQQPQAGTMIAPQAPSQAGGVSGTIIAPQTPTQAGGAAAQQGQPGGAHGQQQAEPVTPEKIAQLQAQMNAQLTQMQSEQTQTAAQLQAAQEQMAAMTAELDVLRQRAAAEAQERARLDSDAQTLKSMGAYLERADALLVSGSDDAVGVVRDARNALASQLQGAPASGRTADLLNYLDAALVELSNGDNNNARGRVWQAMTALFDAAGTVNTNRLAP